MKNRTQLVIGAALLAGVATLLLLPQSKEAKSREEPIGTKTTEQTTVPPRQETQPDSEPKVAPDPALASAENGVNTEEDSPVATEKPEEPTDSILALVDNIEDAGGKVQVLSNLAGSLARAGDAEQAGVRVGNDDTGANDDHRQRRGFHGDSQALDNIGRVAGLGCGCYAFDRAEFGSCVVLSDPND